HVTVFGNKVPLTFPLSRLEDHVQPFGDQRPVAVCPHSSLCRDKLLADSPGADALFRTDFIQHSCVGAILIHRVAKLHFLKVCSSNLTSPYLKANVTEAPISDSEWTRLCELVDESGFWQLPHDDGRRILRKQKHTRWRLEGFADGRYHCVTR